MADLGPVDAATARAALARLLQSRGLAGASRLSRLLTYVVEQSLAGRGDELKEYSLGVEVFDRPSDYDPRLDSIVRVEAGRLRSKLEEYYAGDGKHDPVRIRLPRGGYVPEFEWNGVGNAAGSREPAVGSRPSNALNAAALASAFGLLLLVSLAVWSLGSRSPSMPAGPTIAVLPFQQYSLNADDAALAARLTDGVTAELARLGTLGVVSHTSARQFEGVRKPIREIAAALGAELIMEASVERDSRSITVQARLVNASVDRKFWVEDFRGSPDDLRQLQQRIAEAVSRAVLTRP
jgi:TolB-like protein